MSFINMKDVGITAVSHSRMKTHEGCPRKAQYKFLDKIKEPGNEAMNRGLEKHQELENWLLCTMGRPYEGTGTAPRNGVYGKIRDDLTRAFVGTWREKREVEPEQQVAFDKNWEPCSWFGPEAWMRVVFDLSILEKDKSLIELWDYKTGKVYDDHDQQADLYALAGFKMGYQKVVVKFYYLDQNMVQPYNYELDEVEELTATVEARAAVVTSDRVFPTNPSWKCKWCHFRKENGGPCVH